MHIDDYQLGTIVIEGQTCNADLMICGEELLQDWWRQKGHSLCLNDLKWVLERSPEILIIGKGNSGCMQVPAEILEILQKRGIQIQAATTEFAVQLYNEITKKDTRKIAATFHLTC